MGEEELSVQGLGHLIMLGELRAVVGGQGMDGKVLALEHRDQGLSDMDGAFGWNPIHERVARGAIDQSHQGTLLAYPEHEIGFPVTQAHPGLDDHGSLLD